MNSPGLALGLSIGLPLAGAGMMTAAALPSGDIQTWQNVAMITGAGLVLFGPSGGHYYLGLGGRGIGFTTGRLVLAGLGLVAIVNGIDHSTVVDPDYEPGAAMTSMVQAGLCGAGILALSIWESVSTYRSADRLNDPRHRGVSVAPFVAPSRNGGSLAGLTLGGRF